MDNDDFDLSEPIQPTAGPSASTSTSRPKAKKLTYVGNQSFEKAYGQMYDSTRTGGHYNPDTTTTKPRRVRYDSAYARDWKLMK
ncbi:hypothetical protein LWI29_007134 [Acer saccharum]|uniref:Uncharacterized protein n=1 Tax=Acer saccharum TaxID=4024 RepID=A0AA39W856_ACESA|nr:hypothetical protein LWI29_007134 [Acer saccharum]